MARQLELAEAGAARPWPAERIEFWSIERLIPYAKNARLHTEADIDKTVAAVGATLDLLREDGPV